MGIIQSTHTLTKYDSLHCPVEVSLILTTYIFKQTLFCQKVIFWFTKVYNPCDSYHHWVGHSKTEVLADTAKFSYCNTEPDHNTANIHKIIINELCQNSFLYKYNTHFQIKKKCVKCIWRYPWGKMPCD